MKSKTATRALLALILLCLAILIVRGLRRDTEPEPSPQAAAPEPTGPAEAANAVQEPEATPSAVPRWPLTHEEYIANVPMLIDGLLTTELSAEVRAWTAEQLARASIEDERVNAALRKALADPEPVVAAAAAAALSKRGGSGVAAPPTEARKRAPADAGEPAPPGMRIETLD